MSLKLASAPAQYDPRDQSLMRGALLAEDKANLKVSVAVTFLLMKRPDGTVGRLTVDNTNALSFTPL